jgi:hypothetical protein
MLGKSVLVFSLDKRAGRPVVTSLRATGNEVLPVDEMDDVVELLSCSAVDAAVVECDDAESFGRLVDRVEDQVPIVALSRSSEPLDLLHLVCSHGAHHVIARRGDAFDPGEVTTTVEKILRRDVFGADKYVSGFGVELNTRELRGAGDRDDLVSMVTDYVASLGAGKEVAAAMGAIADELATNAIYNAPRDQSGQSRYGHVDRRDKIELDSWERPTVQFGSDGRRFVIAVTDEFGALSPARIRSRLRDCIQGTEQIEDKRGGAGLGVYTVLQSCNQLVFNLSPGRRTEVLAVADISSRMRGIRDGGHSVHMFVDSGAESAKVEVSEALRTAMRDAYVARKRPQTVVPLVHRKDTVKDPPRREEEVSGQILVFPQETLGVDTMLGLIRGSTRRDQAVELSLRYLTYCYEVAVAYELRGTALRAWFASGNPYDWLAVREHSIDVDHPCALTRAYRDGEISTFRPACPTDADLCAMVAGVSSSPGLAIPICVGGEIKYVLYAAQPKYGRHMARRVRTALRDELQRVASRIASSSSHSASLRRDSRRLRQ